MQDRNIVNESGVEKDSRALARKHGHLPDACSKISHDMLYER